MASDIVITPSRGSTTVNAKIDFTGASTASSQIRLEVLPDNSLAFIGTAGSLFSIADSVTGSLMSVNDASGLPILEVFDTDKVVMGQYNQNTLVVNGTNIGVGTASPNSKLEIRGGTVNQTYDATVYITADNDNDWGIVIDKNRSAATEYGLKISTGSAASYALAVYGGGSVSTRIAGNGDIYAPRMYDSTATAYYVDPGSTSNLNGLTVAGTITGSISGNAATATTATTATNWGSYGTVPAAGTSFGTANTIGRSDANGYAYFYYINSSTSNNENGTVSQFVITNGSDNFYRKASLSHVKSQMGLSASDNPQFNSIGLAIAASGTAGSISLNQSGTRSWSITPTGGNLAFASGDGLGAITYGGSIRATSFFDVSDITYFVDPASTSVLNSATFASSITVGNGATSSYIYMGDSDEGSRAIHNNSNRIGFLNQSLGWGSWCDDTGYWESAYGIRGPAFYDSNDSNYYCDPASTSVFSGLTIAGNTALHAGNVHTDTNRILRALGGNDGMDFNTTSYNSMYYANIASSANKPSSYGYQYGTILTFDPGLGSAGRAQFYVSHAGNDLCFRGGWDNNNSWQAWNRVLTDQQYTSYTLARGGDTMSGILYFLSNKGSGVYLGSTNNPPLQAYSNDGGAAFMSFHRSGSYAVNMGLDPDQVFRIGGWSASSNRLQLDMSGNLWTASSMRTSIFYDQDDTNYYIDPASTSRVNAVSFVSGATFGPYLQYSNQNNLRLQGGSNTTEVGLVGYDFNGNWRFQLYGGGSGYGFLNGNWAGWDIQKVTSGNLYLNNQNSYYIGTSEIYYNRVYGLTDIRSPIFYDNNDTAYWIDPTSGQANSEGGKIKWNFTVNAEGATSGRGLALYPSYTSSVPTYGITFAQTASLGTHGNVTSDWATYFTMNSTANRGWVFRVVDGTPTNVASISNAGRMRIQSLGVNTDPSATAGEIRATDNITAYYSDERLKTKLGAIENPIEKVKALSGFYFEANETAVALGYQKKREVGVSAQEVQAILPEIIAPAPIDEQYMTVRYEKLIPLLIEAIKEQQKQIEELKSLLLNNK